MKGEEAVKVINLQLTLIPRYASLVVNVDPPSSRNAIAAEHAYCLVSLSPPLPTRKMATPVGATLSPATALPRLPDLTTLEDLFAALDVGTVSKPAVILVDSASLLPTVDTRHFT